MKVSTNLDKDEYENFLVPITKLSSGDVFSFYEVELNVSSLYKIEDTANKLGKYFNQIDKNGRIITGNTWPLSIYKDYNVYYLPNFKK